MACGKLVKILLHSKVTRYLEFKSIDGSYVQKDRRLHKVPCTPTEAVNSSLMGIFEKRRFRSMVIYIDQYNQEDSKTHDGFDAKRQTTAALYNKFGVDENTQSFMGHAMALHRDDEYLRQPALETIEAVKLYAYSVERCVSCSDRNAEVAL